jgi:hypothetical protein
MLKHKFKTPDHWINADTEDLDRELVGIIVNEYERLASILPDRYAVPRGRIIVIGWRPVKVIRINPRPVGRFGKNYATLRSEPRVQVAYEIE